MKSNMSAGPEILWAGIDLAKLTFQVAIWGHLLFQEMQCRSFDRTRKAMKVFLVWLRAQAPVGAKMGLVMEATGTFAEEMASWLLDLDPTLWVAIVNPGQTSAFIKSLGFRNKTDDLDAKGLGKYGQERRPAPWERPTPEMAALKDLVRIRMDLISARTAMHLRLKDHKRASKKASDAMRKVILSLKVQIQQLEKAITDQVAAYPTLAHQLKLYTSICGVAQVTATTVMVELGDLRRFPRSRQLTAFAGLSPRKTQSGTSVNGKTRLCKQGSARVRAALFMAASCAARFNPDMKATYERQLAKGKEKRSALGAVMRKLLVLMRAVLIADHVWQPMKAAA
jgi:transposase